MAAVSLRSNSQNFFHFRLTLDDEEGRNGCYVPNPEGGFPFNTKVWFSAQTILGWCVHQWQWWVAECDWEQGQQGFSWDVPSTPRENPNVYYKAHHLLFVHLAKLCAVDFFWSSHSSSAKSSCWGRSGFHWSANPPPLILASKMWSRHSSLIFNNVPPGKVLEQPLLSARSPLRLDSFVIKTF